MKMNIKKGNIIIIEGQEVKVENVTQVGFGKDKFSKVWFIRPSDKKLVFNLPEFIELKKGQSKNEKSKSNSMKFIFYSFIAVAAAILIKYLLK